MLLAQLGEVQLQLAVNPPLGIQVFYCECKGTNMNLQKEFSMVQQSAHLLVSRSHYFAIRWCFRFCSEFTKAYQELIARIIVYGRCKKCISPIGKHCTCVGNLWYLLTYIRISNFVCWWAFLSNANFQETILFKSILIKFNKYMC